MRYYQLYLIILTLELLTKRKTIMQQNPLHENILSKNFTDLAIELRAQDPKIQQELNSEGDSFKTLAIKTLSDGEFDVFCDVMQDYLCEVNKINPNGSSCRR